jgi:hypothetical protein
MTEIDCDQIKTFLESLGERYKRHAKLILLGRSALCLLGNPRPTVDIDYVGDDLQKDDFQNLMAEIAGEMGFEVEAVPIQEFTPLAFGDESHSIPVGRFGKLEFSILDPYVMALSKLDRGFHPTLMTLSSSFNAAWFHCHNWGRSLKLHFPTPENSI